MKWIVRVSAEMDARKVPVVAVAGFKLATYLPTKPNSLLKHKRVMLLMLPSVPETRLALVFASSGKLIPRFSGIRPSPEGADEIISLSRVHESAREPTAKRNMKNRFIAT